MFAAGSDSGIVNIYNRDEFLGGKRKPIKTVENLTTKIDFMKFNSDDQILAICSTMKKNSLKLMHVPSFTVYSNWPPLNKSLHYPRCLDFSPGGGFMAAGNAAANKVSYFLSNSRMAIGNGGENAQGTRRLGAGGTLKERGGLELEDVVILDEISVGNHFRPGP
ncbi:hypothetical protein V6N13_104775 [Hibiscus sabdariffa]|uniref:Uncharacterized protein n=2 Tax=Hibiscus sabdariffa TaxID=183260 RepID=A0ABR2CJ55_9ROSI